MTGHSCYLIIKLFQPFDRVSGQFVVIPDDGLDRRRLRYHTESSRIVYFSAPFSHLKMTDSNIDDSNSLVMSHHPY